MLAGRQHRNLRTRPFFGTTSTDFELDESDDLSGWHSRRQAAPGSGDAAQPIAIVAFSLFIPVAASHVPVFAIWMEYLASSASFGSGRFSSSS